MPKDPDSHSPPGGPDFFPAGARLELVKISPLGAIFRSGREFETGTSVALGIHLCRNRPADTSRFLDLVGTVVDCHRDRTPGLTISAWQVTLLFHGISDRDSTALSTAARHSGSPTPPLPLPPSAPFPPGGFSCFGLDGFPDVCRLN